MSPLPARMAPSDSEAALGMKFLEVCQELTNKSIPFTCTLTIGSTINLSLDTRTMEKKEESTTPLARKKASPSTIRRNARRKALYLEKKEEERHDKDKSKSEDKLKSDTKTELEAPSQKTTFKCDQCDKFFETENGLKIHIGRSHKPQILRDNSLNEAPLSVSPIKDIRSEPEEPDEEEEEGEEEEEDDPTDRKCECENMWKGDICITCLYCWDCCECETFTNCNGRTI